MDNTMIKQLAVILGIMIYVSFSSANANANAEERQQFLPTLQGLHNAIEAIDKKLTQLEGDGDKTEIDADLSAQVVQLKQRRKELSRNFDKIASGVDSGQFDQIDLAAPTWSDDLREVVSPLINELRAMTARSRDAQRLRQELASAEAKHALAAQSVASLESLIKADEDPALTARLQLSLALWQARLLDIAGHNQALSLSLNDLKRDNGNFFDDVSVGFAGFFANRGRSIGIAIAAVIGVWLVFKCLHYLIERFGPMHRQGITRSFSARVFDLGWAILSVVAAIAAVLVTFYRVDDWLLLSVALLFLLGLAWAGKNGLPRYFEQSKLLLNLGAVREGERIRFNEIPWQVGRLGFYTELINPSLQGGLLRVTATDLLTVHSRPCVDEEPWFPTEVGDWILANSEHGQVLSQSPEFTVIKFLGGANRHYTTADFLSLGVVNLSNGFRLSLLFGIDYKHQKLCTTEAPGLFNTALTQQLYAEFGESGFVNINVEFSNAAANALEFAILIDCTADAAQKYRKLERAVQGICVDLCGQQGWDIPFAQMVLHRGDEAG